jgi:hypothetical protein
MPVVRKSQPSKKLVVVKAGSGGSRSREVERPPVVEEAGHRSREG